MEGVAQFAELFKGSDLAHGRSESKDIVSRKGKHEMSSWTEPRPASEEEFQRHLEGKAGLGIPPIRSDSACRWGALDIDEYKDLDIKEFAKQVGEVFPNLVVARSKSGGAHVFLFLEDWAPAGDVVTYLEGVAAWFGFSKCEIFPKQVAISNDKDTKDFGNWINLPYFGGTANLRYAHNSVGDALLSTKAFCDYAALSGTTTLASLREAPAPKASVESEVATELFSDGPPCLGRVWASGVPENRNIALSNAAVYLKKAFPTNWKEKLEEYNRKMTEPLGSSEVEAIKKSYEKKDYKYQCQKDPLCKFCFARVCRERPYGVGGDGLVANNRSLSKFDSRPPIWFLDVDLPDGTVRRISLQTEELQTFRLFQRRVMECLDQCPTPVKQEMWISQVQALMKHVTVITVPEDATPEGHFKQLFYDFIRNRASNEDWEDLSRGLAYTDLQGVNFQFTALITFLDSQRFTELKRSHIASILKDTFNATSKQRRINDRTTRYWSVPASSLDTDDTGGDSFRPKGSEADRPF